MDTIARMDSAALQVSDKFRVTRTGLVIKGKPTFEEWEGAGWVLHQAEAGIQWAIGDWLNYGESKWGEMYAQAVDESTAKTWRNYKFVCGQVELSRRRDKLSFSHHAEVAALECDEQERMLDLSEQNELSIQGLRAAVRNVRLGVVAQSLPAGKYQVIYADPPWQYANSGFSQSAESQYPTMPTDKIAALEIAGMADDNAALFMWVTSPLLPDGLEVMRAWGFEYKASAVWVKNHAPGIGFWVNTLHEILLIGSRGSFVPGEKFDSVFFDQVTTHSRKPAKAYEFIEGMYPSAKKVELFARAARAGWEAWGNQNV